MAVNRRLLGIFDLLEKILRLAPGIVGRVGIVYDFEGLSNLGEDLPVLGAVARVAVGRHGQRSVTAVVDAGGLKGREGGR